MSSTRLAGSSATEVPVTEEVREVLRADGSMEPIQLCYPVHEPWFLDVVRADGRRFKFEDWSFWHCVKKLRESLESEGARLLCGASRPELVVSGMSLDMTGGAVGYLVRLGEIAQLERRIHILKAALPAEVGSLAQQTAFKEQWMESCRAGRED